MKVIYKYEGVLHDDQVVYNFPEDSTVLRVDYVDDGFYKGYFLWAVVDTDNMKKGTILDVRKDYRQNNVDLFHGKILMGIDNHKELRVVEKQKIFLAGTPIGAEEYNGKLYIYHDINETAKGNYEISFFKTGQPIDVCTDNYIGLCKLNIFQELGLYTFYNKVENND